MPSLIGVLRRAADAFGEAGGELGKQQALQAADQGCPDQIQVDAAPRAAAIGPSEITHMSEAPAPTRTDVAPVAVPGSLLTPGTVPSGPVHRESSSQQEHSTPQQDRSSVSIPAVRHFSSCEQSLPSRSPMTPGDVRVALPVLVDEAEFEVAVPHRGPAEERAGGNRRLIVVGQLGPSVRAAGEERGYGSEAGP